MLDPLAPLLADGVIDEVVSRLKSGKEADVWLVRHRDEILAAKVYKARHARSFRNDAAYREGRQVRDTRMQRAMDRGTRFGQAAAEEAWKAKESDAMYRLHAAGLRVPRPVLFYEGVLLMEVVVDGDGRPAPRLVDAGLGREQAAPVYAELRRQAIGMLACDVIHGDLSPYNVLVAWDGPVVIDFPQVVGAAHNSQAERFFLRDLQNIHHFCLALDPALRSAEGDGREIWRAYVRRELTPDFVPTGRAPEPHRPPSAEGRPPDGRRQGGGPRGLGRPRRDGPRQGGSHRHAEVGGDRGGGGHGGGGHGGGGHAGGGGARRDGGASRPQRDERGRRGAGMPEVIRVERLPGAVPQRPATGHGQGGGRGGQGRSDHSRGRDGNGNGRDRHRGGGRGRGDGHGR
jgi:RIO kinase 1